MRRLGLRGRGGGAVEEPDGLLAAGDAGGGDLVEVGAAEGGGDGGGLAVAADQEPHRPGAVERREGQADPLRGRLGGVGDADGDRVATSSCGKPGKSEAMWPSGPMPSIRTSNSPAPCSPQRLGVRRRAGVDVGRVGGRRHRVHVGRVGADGVEERRLGLSRVAVGGVGRDEALVAPPDDDLRPVDLGGGREPGDLAVDRPRRWCRRSARSAGRRRPPGRRRAGCSSSPATAVASAAESSWTSMRAVGHCSGPIFTQLAGGLGVDVVLVEAAQLLGEQLGQVAALERDRPVRVPGGAERRELAVRARDADRALLGLQHDLGDPGARRVLAARPATFSRSPSQAPSRSALGLIRSAVTDAPVTLSWCWSSAAASSARHGVIRVQARSVLPLVYDAHCVWIALPLPRLAPAASVIRRCASAPSGSCGGVLGRVGRPADRDGGVGQQQRQHDGLRVLDDLALEPDQRGLAGPAGARADLGVDLRGAAARRRGSRRAPGRGARARPRGRPPSRRRRCPRRRR